MMPIRSAARSVAGVAIGVAALSLVTLIWIGVTAPPATHPLFDIGLIFFGGGAVGLLFAGVGAAIAGSRARTGPELDRRFSRGIRRLSLAM